MKTKFTNICIDTKIMQYWCVNHLRINNLTDIDIFKNPYLIYECLIHGINRLILLYLWSIFHMMILCKEQNLFKSLFYDLHFHPQLLNPTLIKNLPPRNIMTKVYIGDIKNRFFAIFGINY